MLIIVSELIINLLYFFLEIFRMFDVWCLHIPATDRTPFQGTFFHLLELMWPKSNSFHLFFPASLCQIVDSDVA